VHDEGVADSVPADSVPMVSLAGPGTTTELQERPIEPAPLEQPVAAEDDVQPGADDASGEEPGAAPSVARRAVPWIVLIVTAGVAAVLLRTFLFQTFYVPSSSMEPTLLPGDRMLVLKFDLGTIHRGEIIVFKRPPGDSEDPNNEDLVKRVIGLPGQTIYSLGSTIYIDGKPIAQPWLPKHEAPGPPIYTLKIPKNDYFVMGDNRSVSYDSRYWSPHFVPRADIIGQVLFVIWRNGHPYFKAF
jgi:signal peptidase I